MLPIAPSQRDAGPSTLTHGTPTTRADIYRPPFHCSSIPIHIPSFVSRPCLPQSSDSPPVACRGRLASVEVSQFGNLGEEYGVLGEAEELGSYKWVANDGIPTIAVPGVPDVWLGKEDVGKVSPDCQLKGNIEWPDYTSAHIPPGISQHEPLFLSLPNPSRQLEGVSLITPRNNLRKIFTFLLRQVTPTLRNRLKTSHQSFEINAHRIPGTKHILLDRVEPPDQRDAHTPGDWHLAFHEATTARIFKGSDRTPGCIRAIRYDWAGLGLVVRFDIDAFVPDEGDEVVLEQEGEGEGADEGVSEGGSIWSDLSQLVSGSDFEGATKSVKHSESENTTSTSGFGINPTSTGIQIMGHPYPSPPHKNLISIKIRNIAYSGPPPPPGVAGMKWMNRSHDVYAQLLSARLPSMYLACHNNGTFLPGVRKITTDGKDWADVREEAEKAVRAVRGVLGWIVAITRKYGTVSFVGEKGSITAYGLCGESVSGLSQETLKRLGVKRGNVLLDI